jgi:hypothetical protein
MIKVNIKLISALAATAMLSTAPAFAAHVQLDFEDVTLGTPVANQYAGLEFGGDILGVVNDEFTQFFTGAPSPIGVISSVGSANALNILGPGFFANALTLSYSATENATVSIWSGANGTGSLIDTLNLGANSASCALETPFCTWQSATLAFSGLAKSITFDTAFNAAFDNVQVDAVPLPAAGWLLISALTGFGALRRKRAA